MYTAIDLYKKLGILWAAICKRYSVLNFWASLLWNCWLGIWKVIQPVKTHCSSPRDFLWRPVRYLA